VVKIILMIGTLFMLWSSNATAQQRLSGAPCVPDLRKLCPGIQPGNDRIRNCLREHIRDVSLSFASFATIAAPTFGNSVRTSSVEGESSALA
jgi:hypothetical protein